MDFAKKPGTGYQPFLNITVFILCGIILAACQVLSNINQSEQEIKITSTLPGNKPQVTPKITHSMTPSPIPTSQFQIEPSELNNVSLNFWHPWNGDKEEILNQLIDEFNSSNAWKIQVNPIYQGGYDEVGERVYNAINTGGYPEIAIGYPYQAAKWRSVRNIILDLDEYRRDPEWGLTFEEEKAFYPLFQNQWDDPSNWGFPAQRTAQFLIYNKSWAEELGFSAAPSTPSEFKSQACAAHKSYSKDDNPDNDSFGGLIISANYPTTLAWIFAFGGEILKQDGSGYQFNTTQVNDAFEFLRTLYDDGCAWVSNNQPPVAEFSDREGLFISGNLDTISLLQSNLTVLGNDDEWEIITFPSSTNTATMIVYGPDYFIFESTPAKQLASWLFIKWLSMPENQAKLITSHGTLPLQPAVMNLIDKDKRDQPRWQSLDGLMLYAKTEPLLPSWGVIRWAVSDATTQLFQWYFKADQIPSLTKLLNETAADFHKTLD